MTRTIPLKIPHGYQEVIETYGDPKFDGSTVDPKWEQDNMIVVRDLFVVPKLYVHKLVADPLRKAIRACLALNDGYKVKRIGCFNPRLQRGSKMTMSLHTFGIAIDMNPDQNRLLICGKDDPRRKMKEYSDIPAAWIECFKNEGWFWGGNFQKRFDPMHLQMATGL